MWQAAELITSSKLEARWKGFNTLLEVDAIRQSSLIAYLISTQITETNLGLRTAVILAIADVLSTSDGDGTVSEEVRSCICDYLSQMRVRQIYGLLQAAEYDLSTVESVYQLLNCSSYSGKHLSDILLDRKAPVLIRMRAVNYIARIGYLDALPILERAAKRIESRENGRFVNGSKGDERELFQKINEAMEILREP